MSTFSRSRHAGFFWLTWLLLSAGLCAYFYYAVSTLGGAGNTLTRVFLPGKTSNGHHQIETACVTCHTEPFGGKALLQDACMQCHAAELKQVEDSHPKKKFTDPRNANTLEKLDARYCVACHVEHRPAMTKAMGVTQPNNFCFHCHADVAEERPSHQGMDFNTCATGGCHNFHDNKALYEDFLLKHRADPAQLPRQRVDARDLLSFITLSGQYPAKAYPVKALSLAAADAPEKFLVSSVQDDWLTTQHAKAGVNCTACHQVKDEKTAVLRWVERPNHTQCQVCHQEENAGFLAGKHGMRLAVGLPPLTPADARLPMKPDSQHRQMTCISCHTAHRFDTRLAAVDSCLQCHDDSHSRQYRESAHARLWAAELAGKAPTGSGVSCATCHLPRVWHEDEAGVERILVEHNQNNTLRPNEKMLRPVCLQCHGLAFSIDALADPALVANNFHGMPASHNKSLEMALEAEQLHKDKKDKAKKPD